MCLPVSPPNQLCFDPLEEGFYVRIVTPVAFTIDGGTEVLVLAQPLVFMAAVFAAPVAMADAVSRCPAMGKNHFESTDSKIAFATIA